MASAQEAGQVTLYLKKTNGDRKKLWESHVSIAAPGGGAPDGALASVKTPNELLFAPVSSHAIDNDDIIEVQFVAEGADGIDVSDCIWLIPIMVNGSVKHLSRAQFANPAPADYTTVANIPTIVGGYKVTEASGGTPVRFGGGQIYVDIQDDTA